MNSEKSDVPVPEPFRLEMVDERNDYFQQQTDGQMSSVDNNLMRENDPRMPLFKDKSTKVTFGSGKGNA